MKVVKPLCIGMILEVLLSLSLSTYAGEGGIRFVGIAIGLLCFWLLQKKKMSVPKVIGIAAALGVVGSGTTDLTVGRPLTRILQFALPLVLGTLFQQLYSFVDTIIVGRCIGTDALGAVGTTLVAAPLLQLIHTPAELLENAVRYIRIIFLGIPATVLYNDSSTVLRSLGDSKHPLHAAGPWLQRTGRHLRRGRAHRPRPRRLAGRAPAGLFRHLHLEPPRLGLCPVLLRVHGHTGAEKGEPGGINQNQKSAPRFCTAERFFGGKLS